MSPSSSNLDTCQAEDPKSPVGSPMQKRAEGSGVHEPDTTGPAKPPVPADFCCPISMDIMRDPVLVATGQTYDKVCIEKWLNSGRRTCPKTGVKLRHMELTPNIALRNIIQVRPFLACTDIFFSHWRASRSCVFSERIIGLLFTPALEPVTAHSPRAAHMRA